MQVGFKGNRKDSHHFGSSFDSPKGDKTRVLWSPNFQDEVRFERFPFHLRSVPETFHWLLEPLTRLENPCLQLAKRNSVPGGRGCLELWMLERKRRGASDVLFEGALSFLGDVVEGKSKGKPLRHAWGPPRKQRFPCHCSVQGSNKYESAVLGSPYLIFAASLKQ